MFPRSFIAALLALLIAVPLVRAQSKTGNAELGKPQPPPVVTLPDQSKLDEYLARWEKEIPLRRIGEPREFAALAAFLVSERASYITGTSTPVDGGWIKAIM